LAARWGYSVGRLSQIAAAPKEKDWDAAKGLPPGEIVAAATPTRPRRRAGKIIPTFDEMVSAARAKLRGDGVHWMKVEWGPFREQLAARGASAQDIEKALTVAMKEEGCF
jgi:hypothetical protein